MSTTSTKIFQCLEELTAQQLVRRLRRYSSKEQIVTNPETGGTTTLHTTIERIRSTDNERIVRGYVRYDTGIEIRQRDGPLRYIVKTNEVPFSFLLGNIHFIPFASGVEANAIAEKMNQIVFEDMQEPILSCNITPPRIEDFLQNNPNEITNCWWTNVRIPNLSRAGLAGTGIDRTTDFRRYDTHGDKGSIRLRLLEHGWSILINQYASVVFYSNVERDEIEDFLRREIIPRCN